LRDGEGEGGLSRSRTTSKEECSAGELLQLDERGYQATGLMTVERKRRVRLGDISGYSSSDVKDVPLELALDRRSRLRWGRLHHPQLVLVPC
jgi:hypothetical protein